MIPEAQKDNFIKHLQNGDGEAIKDFISALSKRDKNQLTTMELEFEELGFLTPLSYAAHKGHHEVLKTLLAIPAVRDTAAAKDNRALCWAADAGHLEIVKTLLAIPAVRDNAAIRDNDALRWATFNGHHEVVKALLAVDAVRDTAAAINNGALRGAAFNGHHEVLKTLLAIPAVRDNAATRDNEALCFAADKGHHEMVKILLAVKAVQQCLLANDGQQLIAFINKYAIVLNDVIDTLSIYGMSLSRLMEMVPQKEKLATLNAYIANPLGYLAEKGFSAAVIAAVNIYYTAQNKTAYEQRLAERERNMERFNNVDDEARIGSVRRHYKDIIKPYLRETFEQYGQTDSERITKIESKIREMLLKRILAEAKDNNERSIIAFIEGLSDAQRQALCEDSDETLMTEARVRLIRGDSDSQTAWRAYDKHAQVGGDWPNLLTPALDAENNHAVYTVRTVGITNPTLDMASQLSREMTAYTYLLVIDEQDGDDEARATRETTFTSKIAEIRRAHNENAQTLDDPSCLPGTISRMGDMWAAHAKGITPDASQLLEEEMGSLIVEHFQKAPPETQEALFEALVMLSSYNAEDIIAGKTFFSDEAMYLRQGLMDSLGTHQALEATLNEHLTARDARALTQEEFAIYVPALLADIGGPWNIARLKGIYGKYRVDNQTLTNPWGENLESTVPPNRMKMQLMNFLQGARLISMRDSMQIATLFSEKKSEAAIEIIRKTIANEGECSSLIKGMNEIVNAPAIKREKATLWDQLYRSLKDSPDNKNSENLRLVVNFVVDKKVSLEEAMATYFSEEAIQRLEQKNKLILTGLQEHKKRKRDKNPDDSDKKMSAPTKKS